MPKASPIIHSFNAGELSPTLKGRIDLEKYRSGCETMSNFLPQVSGAARKRTGTRFVNEVKDSSTAVRLLRFEYSTEQAYVLEFGDEYIRFYANGGVVLDGGAPYEIVSPYAAADLAGIQYAQSADVVYIAHKDYPPHKLSRFGATDWTIEPIEFNWPPFNDLNTTDVTLTASAVTGSITLTASADTFAADWVGDTIKIEETLASKYDLWTSTRAYSAGDKVRYGDNLYITSAGGTAGSRPPIHLKGTESDGGMNWTFVNNGSGYVEITSYVSATVVNATVVIELPPSATSGTLKWAEGAWSDRKGYPRAVTFYENRLWFAGSENRPQTLWASVSGGYENHQYGTKDDDALNYTINTQDMNTILWIMATKVLSIGTANGEFTLSASQISDAVTPTNVRIVPQTSYGAAEDVSPLRIGGTTLFLQRSARKLREYTYNFETDAYVAVNLNTLADHIAKDGIVDLAYQQEPHQIVWAPSATGELLGLTYERSENVVGWHRHDVGGEVESVVCIPHWDGDQDVLFMVVRRDLGGASPVRYIEYFEKFTAGSNTTYLDCSLTYNGASTTTISGLDHLEGVEVSVVANGATHPNRTVTSGSITLQSAATSVVVGLPYTATLRTMPLEAGAADGVAQGKTMRVTNIVIRLHETGPGLWFGPSESQMDELHVRKTTDLMDTAIPLYTGDTNILPWPGEYQNRPQITIQHRLPQSCIIIAVMPQLHTYDR